MLAFALAAALPACAGNPQRLPVGLSICNAVTTARGFTVTATVENTGDRPISNLGLSMSFYRDFRYSSFTASRRLKTELDPGQKRDVSFDVANVGKAPISGQALRCLVTHIGYLDSTSVDVPPSQ